MRLLLLNGNTDPSVTGLLARSAAAALPRLGLQGIELVPATAAFGARYIATRAAAAVAAHAVLDAIARHAGGIDAAAIACFGDPGLDAAREIAAVPVVGMAEASIAAGLLRAPRIALLTGGALWVPMLEEFCRLRGLGPEQVLVRHVAPTGDMIMRSPTAARALLHAAIRAATAEGAGAVVLGGAGLVGLAAQLQDDSPVPLLDSLDCLLVAAAGGLAPRPASPAPATPSDGLSPALAQLLAGA